MIESTVDAPGGGSTRGSAASGAARPPRPWTEAPPAPGADLPLDTRDPYTRMLARSFSLLEAIYSATVGGAAPASSGEELERALGVAPAEVQRIVNVLLDIDLVRREGVAGVALTAQGRVVVEAHRDWIRRRMVPRGSETT